MNNSLKKLYKERSEMVSTKKIVIENGKNGKEEKIKYMYGNVSIGDRKYTVQHGALRRAM